MHSLSRNNKIIKEQSKRGYNTNKAKSKLIIKSKRRSSEFDLCSKNIMNLSLNKLPLINRNKNDLKLFGLNKTYIASPGLSLNNISISKIKKKEKNKINISKNTKNVLL